jgi:hypothetical protein
MEPINSAQFHASLMLAEVAAKAQESLDKINSAHPGLDSHHVSKLRIMRAMLEDVEHQIREMARSLLLSSRSL